MLRRAKGWGESPALGNVSVTETSSWFIFLDLLGRTFRSDDRALSMANIVLSVAISGQNVYVWATLFADIPCGRMKNKAMLRYV